MTDARPTPRFDPLILHQAAALYYEQDATQADIATQLGVSRPTVSRLLSEARRVGIVEIRVHDPASALTVDLDRKVRDALGLQEVWVAAGAGGRIAETLADPFVKALRSADLLPGDTLLVSSGRTLFELGHHRLPRLPGLEIVPTVGGVFEPEPWYQTNEITRMYAERLGGRPHFLFAPAMPSTPVRASLEEDPGFRDVVALWNGAKAALVGIGAPPAVRNSIARGIPRAEESLAHAVGDICLNFFGPQGEEVDFPGAAQMVRTRPDLLRRIPFVVAVAAGEDKVHSIIGGARAGLFNRLVTDLPTARLVLSETENQTV